jgi:hypothetical protein
VAETGGKLLGKIMFELIALIFEEIRNVAYDKNLSQFSLKRNTLDFNLDDLRVLVLHL